MVSAPARACSISVERIVALADEFLLLKAQMSAMQRQFESVLAEVALELEVGPVSADVKAIVSQRPAQQDNRSDLKPEGYFWSRAGFDNQFRDGRRRATLTTSSAEELEAEMSDNSSNALMIRDIHAVPQTAAMRAEHRAPGAEIDRPTTTVHPNEAEGNSVGSSLELAAQQETHGLASPFPYNAIVLGSHREQAMQKSPRAPATTARRWVTATFIVAAIVAAAVGSSVAML